MARGKQVRNLNKAIDLLSDKTFCVVTGAGVSTGSGIPDYRGRGSAPIKPLNLDPFLEDEEYRKDFWIQGYEDWRKFSIAGTNVGHEIISDLGRLGFVNGVITQNVDGLHWGAESPVVAELHGNMYSTSCVICLEPYATQAVVAQVENDNPGLLGGEADKGTFVVPTCEVCFSPLKPDVVFFGQDLPEAPFNLAARIAFNAEAMVIAGSSLNVISPRVFVRMMANRKLPIIIINKGRTQMDDLADVIVRMDISEAFTKISERLVSPMYA